MRGAAGSSIMGESVLYFGNVVDQRHRGDVYSARVGSTIRTLSSLIKRDEHHETPNCAPPNWPANCVARVGLGVGPGFRLALAAALVLAAALGRDVPCLAGLLIEAPSLLATPGSSSSFDLLLVNTNPAGGASYNVAADSFELSLLGPVAVTFTDVSINTIVPYIYVVSGTTVPGGLPLSLDTFPNTQFTASDAEFGPLGFQTVNPGDTFGLAQ